MRNQGYDYREQIGPRGSGASVLDHLAGSYGHSSRQEWRQRILSGLVELDGQCVLPETVLRAGQQLVWRRPPWNEPEAPQSFALLHRDEHLLAVAKPAGLPCQPGGGFLASTLLSLVQRRWPEATLVHRLGRGTSGVVLFARSDLARASLAAMFRRREPRKIYLALVRGTPREDCFTVETPIGKVSHSVLGGVFAASPSGRPAWSEITVEERRADGSSLVRVRIRTGRPHQIRIHLAVAGHPLVGDPLYGSGGRPFSGALPGETGYWLHAESLRLLHPAARRTLELGCGPPEPLRRLPT